MFNQFEKANLVLNMHSDWTFCFDCALDGRSALVRKLQQQAGLLDALRIGQLGDLVLA